MPPVLEPPASAPAAAVKQINVSDLPAPVTPSAPPKPGSAKEKMHNDLRQKAGIAPEPPKPAQKEPERPGTQEPPSKPQDAPQPEAATKTDPVPKPETVDQKKVSPWKLVEQFKERVAKAEQRALEIEKQLLPEPERKAQSERLTRAEARAKELEDEMRYVNYAKHPEFAEKYQKPYVDAWTSAMRDTQGIQIDNGDGTARPFTAEDMVKIVNTAPALTGKVAKQMIGDDDIANFVMLRAEKIRDLNAKQSEALEQARTQGSERERQRKEQYEAAKGQMSQQVREAWEAVNREVLDRPVGEYFKPREGDDTWNELLTKGFAMVDRAFGESPTDPRLTPEQRKEVIKRHAGVRNRAAGWAGLKVEVVDLRKKVGDLETELGKYRETTPVITGTVAVKEHTMSAREQMIADLNKRAK